MKKKYTGINIQFPISQLILSGEKSIETRTYPIPENYLNVEMLFIETPGKSGKFKSRIVARIIFSKCFKYKTKSDFYKDFDLHKVNKSSQWAWNKDKGKWGWQIGRVEVFKKTIPVPKRTGIVFTKDIEL